MHPGDIYARVFENAQTGLLLLEGSTGRILEVNAAFLRMAGRACTEVVGRDFWGPPLIADADAGAELHQHLLAGGAVVDAELPLRAGDGRWLLLEVSARVVAGLIQLDVRDATGREQVRLAERMQTLRLLAARTAAHFRNLHRVVLTTDELLWVGTGQGQPVREELEEIRQAGERASSIAAQLQAFSGGLEIHIQPVALNDLVENVLPGLRHLLGPDIQIVMDADRDLAPVAADPLQVRQIILTLAANSREAMECGGTFCVQTANAAIVDPGLGSVETSGGPFGVLTVSDSGPGLDDQSWAHVYEPFFTTKAKGRNLGLGLAAVYGIVRQSGGQLWAYSQPGKGTTFRIYFPVAGTHFPALSVPLVDRFPGSATILLVEANDGMRTVMANLLKRRGYRVLAALHANEALRTTETHGAPDLLICRPKAELAGLLTRRHPLLRVLYLCGYGDGHVAPEQGWPPGTALLQKPFKPDALLASVVQLLSEPL
jgi:two-component system, cell cycle sensor histidine kinase and response regulator CckA